MDGRKQGEQERGGKMEGRIEKHTLSCGQERNIHTLLQGL